jgi:LytS/YehU family sensor histidine kinase
MIKGPFVAVPLLINLNGWNIFWIAALAGLITAAVLFWLRTSRERAMLRELLTEQELKALRAQLNPHMLQNSFEIMASRITNQGSDSAIGFVRQVSSYLRFVLHVSDKSVITLEEELEFTEKYLALQKDIAEGTLDYSIHVDDSVDTYGIDVPCMFLQPIVENSIIHGFKDSTGCQGQITITVEQRQEDVICTLSDNGCGLSKSSSNAEHISKGLRLTIKRLELLCRKKKRPPYMEVSTNKSGGVTTIIKIPIY